MFSGVANPLKPAVTWDTHSDIEVTRNSVVTLELPPIKSAITNGPFVFEKPEQVIGDISIVAIDERFFL